MLLYFGLVLNLLCIFGILCSPQILHRPLYVNESALIPRVVNGYEAALGDVPYQVSFKWPINRSKKLFVSFCGGTIIGPSKLVSAAHCFAFTKSKSFAESIILKGKELAHKFAVAGTLLNREVYRTRDTPTGAQWRMLKMVIYPSGFKFPKDDIAVVLTYLPFTFNKYVSPISYARRFIDYRGECLVSGYGRISLRQKITSDSLLLATLELLPFYWCTQKHRKSMEKFICTLGKVSDVAQGDSGGPLVCSGTGESVEGSKGILVGIVSGHGRIAGSFFTRVSAYSNYISRNDANSGHIMSLYYCVIVSVYCAFCLHYFVFSFRIMLDDLSTIQYLIVYRCNK